MITGASSGIGKEFARQLANKYDLMLVARRKDLLEVEANDLRITFGASVETLQADLSEAADVSMVSARLVEEDRLGLLVYNAGFGIEGSFWECSLADQGRMHRLHVMSTLTLSHAALRRLILRNAGGIIDVSPVAGFVLFGNITYGSTKAWMISFGNGLNVDLRAASLKVKVQTLCPGYTHTNFQAAMGIGPRKFAPASAWMTSEEVVRSSLEGFSKGRVIVMPGWRNRLLAALMSRLPVDLRVSLLAKKAQEQSLPQLR
jgi:short-subunit dehydrogenase